MWGYFIPELDLTFLAPLAFIAGIVYVLVTFWEYILIWLIWIITAFSTALSTDGFLRIFLQTIFLAIAIFLTMAVSNGAFSNKPKTTATNTSTPICHVAPQCTYGENKIPVLINNTSSIETIVEVKYRPVSSVNWKTACSNLSNGRSKTIYFIPGNYEFKIISKSPALKNKTDTNLYYQVSLCEKYIKVNKKTMLCFGGLNFFPYTEKDVINGIIQKNPKYGKSTKTKITNKEQL